VEELRRISTGPFSVNEAYTPENIASVSEKTLSEKLRPPIEVGSAFHRITLTEGAERRLLNGLCVPMAEAGRYVPGSVELRHGLCVEGGNMMGFADINFEESNFTENHSDIQILKPILKPKVNIVMGEYCLGEHYLGEQK